jgi:hypothetical protein
MLQLSLYKCYSLIKKDNGLIIAATSDASETILKIKKIKNIVKYTIITGIILIITELSK